jgi:hypothetical protein
LGQNGTESGFHGSAYVETKGQTAPGLQVAPKASTIICSTDHGKPHGLLLSGGRILVRVDDGSGGKGGSKKRMLACNGQDRDRCPDLKGCRLTPGVSQQRREVNP